MKTVVIITPYWKNSPGGGILTSVTGLVEALGRRDVKAKIIFSQGTDSENYGIRGHRFLFPMKAFWILRRIRPEVIHSQSTWYCLLPGYLWKKFHRVRLIHTFRSEPDKHLFMLNKIFLQFLVNRCDCVTFVSKALKDNMERVWGLRFTNAEITYGGVTSREVTENEIREFRERFGLNDNSIVLLAQALTANKHKVEGLKLLIRSLKHLRNRQNFCF